MITQKMIMELRGKTGAGVMSCRNTLQETNGDLEKAAALLKEQGAAIAAKKAERTTAAGLICGYVSPDHTSGALVEVNCETDFVALNKDFIALAENLARQAALTPAQDEEEFAAVPYFADERICVRDAVTSLVAKLRENIVIGRVKTFITKNGRIQCYLHNGGRIGVLAEIASEAGNADDAPALLQIGKEVAMQIAAANPQFIARTDIAPAVLEEERQTYRMQALNAGKPEAVATKVAAGKLAKYLKEKCLLEQAWIKNEEITLADYLDEQSRTLGTAVAVARFARFERGADPREV